jgi:hypothetical protein
MNKQESNKLLAEFMGCYQNNEGFWGFENTPNHKTWNNDRFLDCTKYDTDWNWLIEIVEKIESFVDENKHAKYNFITEQSFVEIIDNNTSDTIVEIDRDTKMEATYNACVQFVQWYNNQNK